jgi:hypothetical protein
MDASLPLPFGSPNVHGMFRVRIISRKFSPTSCVIYRVLFWSLGLCQDGTHVVTRNDVSEPPFSLFSLGV